MEQNSFNITRREFFKLASVGSAVLTASILPWQAFAAPKGNSLNTTVVSMDEIKLAAERLSGNIRRTPVVAGGQLSQYTGVDLHLKLESMQYTGAFKERGALNKMSSMTKGEKARGVIAASTGNHAQGVAYHATRLSLPSTIVMPHGTPNMKVTHTKLLGANVVIHGSTFDDALAFALNKASKDGLTFIHPFEDPLVICGQGTVGLEIMEVLPDLDVLVVPVGGGGLISGCATAAKAIKPTLKIYGVEAKGYSAMRQRLHGQPIVTGGETIAEGIAVHNVGDRTYSIINELVDDVLVVEEGSIEKAISLLFEDRKIVSEGAGAVGVAACIEHGKIFEGKKVATPITGGNIDSRMFATLLNRNLARGGKLVNLRVTSSGQGEVYPEIANLLAKNDALVVNLTYDQIFHATSAKSPSYNLVLETRDMRHAEQLVKDFRASGFKAELIK
ncbi:threonine ammonia-lyase [Marinifilum sp. JC120]|nr:threonine ammonia-lyase [Marinifilum sp. JC120]